EDVTDEEIVDGMRLLAETEGIFTETAGGVTVSVAKKLIKQGRIKPGESTVLCITGNGLKTQEALQGHFEAPAVIQANLASFEELIASQVTV
ncbi:MAG: pyridoxal-phosphate dependent enzyme, partial [Nitrospinaceae bacterium]